MLERDRSRPIIGQTLTRHAEGIEKDINWLLFSDYQDIPIYLYANTSRNESRVREVVHRARKILPERASLLRLYSYPSDFQVDNEEDRNLIYQIIREHVADDLLMKVLFGRITSIDVSLLLAEAGIPGLIISTLERIAVDGFFNFPAVAKPLGIPPSTLRPRVKALVTAGMLDVDEKASLYRANERGKTLLRICHLVSSRNTINAELSYVLDRLGMEPNEDGTIDQVDNMSDRVKLRPTPKDRLRLLLFECSAARDAFGLQISGGPYATDQDSELLQPPGGTNWIGR